jgi:hypothetical protein
MMGRITRPRPLVFPVYSGGNGRYGSRNNRGAPIQAPPRGKVMGCLSMRIDIADSMVRFIFLFGWFCWLPIAVAQSVFTSNTQLVTVGIVVTTKDGKPVRDLEVSEVRIKDNGRLQQIWSLERSDIASGADPARPARGLPEGYRSKSKGFRPIRIHRGVIDR